MVTPRIFGNFHQLANGNMGHGQSMAELCQVCEEEVGDCPGGTREDDEEISRRIDQLDEELELVKKTNVEIRSENRKLQLKLKDYDLVGNERLETPVCGERISNEPVAPPMTMLQSVEFGKRTPNQDLNITRPTRTPNSFGAISQKPNIEAVRQNFNEMIGLGQTSAATHIRASAFVYDKQCSTVGSWNDIPSTRVHNDRNLPDPPFSPGYQNGNLLPQSLPDPPRVAPSAYAGLMDLKRENEMLKQCQAHCDGMSHSAPVVDAETAHAQLMELRRENEMLRQRQVEYGDLSRTASASSEKEKLGSRVDQLTRENEMLKSKIRNLARNTVMSL